MRKRIIAVALVLVFALSMTAYALEPRGTPYLPSLTFDGTTALCSIKIIRANADIDVTLTLYRGLSIIDSWSESGTNSVIISGQCEVKEGLEYRLEVTGTIDGVPFTGTPVYGTC